eukprot:7535940-Pyramimonas_sp.AAC.1
MFGAARRRPSARALEIAGRGRASCPAAQREERAEGSRRAGRSRADTALSNNQCCGKPAVGNDRGNTD